MAERLRRRVSADDWRILRALCIYRLTLVALLVFLYYSGIAPRFLGQDMPVVFETFWPIYLGCAIVLLAAVLYRAPALTPQTFAQFSVDTAGMFAVLMSSGGISSGLGILLVTPVVGYALVLPPRLTVLLASIGALALLGEEGYRQLRAGWSAQAFTEAGILGAVFYVVALAANAVATRARASEAQVERVGSELLNLSRINDSIVESMRPGVLVLDESGTVRLLNAAARRLLHSGGVVVGERLATLAPPLAADLARWQEGRGGEPGPLTPAPRASEVLPRYSWLGRGGTPPVLVLLDDAAEVREEAQRIKLAALGRLSASIAHEIRNPLAAISNAGELLGESLTERAGETRLVEIIQRQTRRIERIVRDVMDLSRRDTSTPTDIVLDRWLRTMAAQYEETHPAETRPVEIAPLWADLRARFDPDHLQQVLFNLWDNSFAHGGTRVIVSAGRLEAGVCYLECRDDGPGIPEAVREHIFEPFYTTGHGGTGLGLYLARELCDYNRARLYYVPGERGACFRIAFASSITGGTTG